MGAFQCDLFYKVIFLSFELKMKSFNGDSLIIYCTLGMDGACTERVKRYDVNLIIFIFHFQEVFPALVPLRGLHMRTVVICLAQHCIPGTEVKDNVLSWALIS